MTHPINRGLITVATSTCSPRMIGSWVIPRPFPRLRRPPCRLSPESTWGSPCVQNNTERHRRFQLQREDALGPAWKELPQSGRRCLVLQRAGFGTHSPDPNRVSPGRYWRRAYHPVQWLRTLSLLPLSGRCDTNEHSECSLGCT